MLIYCSLVPWTLGGPKSIPLHCFCFQPTVFYHAVFRTFFDEYNATMYNMMHMHDHPHRHGKGNGNGYGFFDPLGLTNSTGRRLNQAPGLNSTRMQDLRTYIEDVS